VQQHVVLLVSVKVASSVTVWQWLAVTVYQKPVRDVNEMKQYLSETWSAII